MVGMVKGGMKANSPHFAHQICHMNMMPAKTLIMFWFRLHLNLQRVGHFGMGGGEEGWGGRGGQGRDEGKFTSFRSPDLSYEYDASKDPNYVLVPPTPEPPEGRSFWMREGRRRRVVGVVNQGKFTSFCSSDLSYEYDASKEHDCILVLPMHEPSKGRLF